MAISLKRAPSETEVDEWIIKLIRVIPIMVRQDYELYEAVNVSFGGHINAWDRVPWDVSVTLDKALPDWADELWDNTHSWRTATGRKPTYEWFGSLSAISQMDINRLIATAVDILKKGAGTSVRV